MAVATETTMLGGHVHKVGPLALDFDKLIAVTGVDLWGGRNGPRSSRGSLA